MQCLEYASNKYQEFFGSKPSSGLYPGNYWDNATNRQSGIRVPSVAIWVNNNNTKEGHALLIHSYDASTKAYKIYEANWDGKGNTRTIYRDDVKGMYPSKVWKGVVYN